MYSVMLFHFHRNFIQAIQLMSLNKCHEILFVKLENQEPLEF